MSTKDGSKDALGDSGATSNFVPVESAGSPDGWQKCGGVAVAANNQTMRVMGAHAMKWQNLPSQTHKVLPGLNDTIISVPRLADQGLISVFMRDSWLVVDETTFALNPDARIMARGYREPHPGGLYRMGQEQHVPRDRVDLMSEDADDFSDVAEKCFTIGTQNTYYSQVKLRDVAERAAFYHATFGFPSISALYKALARHLTLPGLTHHEFADNAPKSVHTARGHLHELPHGQGSTKPTAEKSQSEKIVDDPAELERLSAERQLPRKLTPGYLFALPDDAPIKKGEWYIHHTGKLTADATGKLPVPSYMGHTAIWIAYHPESGYIRAVAIKTKADISRLLEKVYQEQLNRGHRIDTVFIDNEVDNDARAFFAHVNVKVNQVAPYCHRANPAERAIGTFKDHFVAMLSGRDPTCPLAYWNEAVTQAEITLNLMRPGPDGKSAYEAYWKVPYDLAAHPMVPWGTRCEAYVPKALRTTYGYRSQPSFYVGASYANYRSHRLIAIDPEKKIAVHARQQVVFYPHEVPFMRWSEMADLKARVSDLSKTMLKVIGKTDANAVNAAEQLQAYCDSIILDPQSDNDDPLVSGSGTIYWLGPQKIDPVTGAVFYELEQPPSETPPAALVVQPAVPAPPVAKAPTAAATELTPAQMLGLDPEPDAPEQTPITGHVRVSEGVQMNTDDAHVSEGVDAPPRHEARGRGLNGDMMSRAMTREAERQRRLDTLATIAMIDPDRIQVVVDKNRVAFDDAKETAYEEVDNSWIKVTSKKGMQTFKRRSALNAAVNILKESDHKTLTIRQAMRGSDAGLWRTALAQELDRFGAMPHIRMLTPEERPKIHNAHCLVQVLEHKAGKERRVRAAFDGSRTKDKQEIYTAYQSNLTTKKIFWSILAANSEKGIRHCTMDIGSFFLHNRNLLEQKEYCLFPSQNLPDSYKAQFASFIGDDGYIMFECGQAVYGMYNAGTIAGLKLDETLLAADYYEVCRESCMWRSKRVGEELVCFILNVDDIGFQGIPGAGHKERLIAALAADGYEVAHTEYSDSVQNHCGYQVVHDTVGHTVTVSMPGYVDEMLAAFEMTNVQVQDHPYRYSQPAFSSKAQSPAAEDDSTLLDDKQIKELQTKLGKLQWYCNICYEIVTIVSKIASAQSRPSTKVLKDVNHVIAYLAGRKNTALTFHQSNMQLSTESDASFASESKSKSRIGGVFLIGGYKADGTPVSSPVGVFSKVADCHPDSAAEAEYVACHDVVKKGVAMRMLLEDFGFPQTGPTENRSDNDCAVKMTNGLVMDRKTKHIDRRYHWVRHELKKGTFAIKWYKGSSNLADFFTKLMNKENHRRFTDMFTKQFTAKEGVLDGRSIGDPQSIIGPP